MIYTWHLKNVEIIEAENRQRLLGAEDGEKGERFVRGY